MLYFNVEIQIKDGVATTGIYARTNLDDAVTKFYQSMSLLRTAVDEGTLDEDTGMVINSFGGVEEVNHYSKVLLPEE